MAKAEDLDERTRHQYLAVLQFLRHHNLLETLSALESETGLSYNDGDLPTGGVLEGALDMFANYQAGGTPGKEPKEDAAAKAAEEALRALEPGACCTGPCWSSPEPVEGFSANVTAVAWAATRYDELLTVVASSDRRLSLLNGSEVLTELSGLESPPLSLDMAPVTEAQLGSNGCQEVLATFMGGEVLLLHLKRPAPGGKGESPSGDVGEWHLEISQRFKDHTKHVTSGCFAPLDGDQGSPTAHFITVSRDWQANLYRRAPSAFGLVTSVRMTGEVTCACWLNSASFAFAVREDHHLHYWDVAADGERPKERMKINMNALGDTVVSFAVLSLAASPDGSLVAACTDKSRIIVFQAFSNRQLRNLYGAVVDDYDVPSVCFSLDMAFIYGTSTLPQAAVQEDDDRVNQGMSGQITVFDVKSGERVLQLPAHKKAVRCMRRHPLSEMLVTGSFDKTVRYWS